MESHYQALISLLEALCASWQASASPADIRFDVDKLKLLKTTCDLITSHGDLSDETLSFIEGVFLRDIWADRSKGNKAH